MIHSDFVAHSLRMIRSYLLALFDNMAHSIFVMLSLGMIRFFHLVLS